MTSNAFLHACLPCEEQGGSAQWMQEVYRLPCGKFCATNGVILGVDAHYSCESIPVDDPESKHVGLGKLLDKPWIRSCFLSKWDGFYMPFTADASCEDLCVIRLLRCGVEVLAVIKRKNLLTAREGLGIEAGISVEYDADAEIVKIGPFNVYKGCLKLRPYPVDRDGIDSERTLLVMTVSLIDIESNVAALRDWRAFYVWKMLP